MRVGGQRHDPAALPAGKIPGTHCTGGWVGPRAGLDVSGKSHPPPGFDPRTVQPVASQNYFMAAYNVSLLKCRSLGRDDVWFPTELSRKQS